MTHQPDDPHRDHLPDGVDQPPADQPRSPGDGDGDAFDEEAAWRMIVENYGDRPEMGVEALPDDDRGSAGPFDRSYLSSLEEQEEAQSAWEDEGHFVPPVPPPLPLPEPRRRLAWAGLFGAPLVLLLAVVFGWVFPTWLVGMLVASFVGGFVYLVATMPRRGHDDWSGDDGAVV